MEFFRKITVIGILIMVLGIGISSSIYVYSIPLAESFPDTGIVFQDRPRIIQKDLSQGQDTSVSVEVIPFGTNDVLLNTKIIDPNGDLIFNQDYENQLLTTFIPTVAGTYKVATTITSQDKASIETIIGPPWVVERHSNMEAFEGGFEFMYIFVLGIIIAFVGMVVTIKEYFLK